MNIAFFTDSQGDKCEANDIDNALQFSTSTIPNYFICFNVTDLFAQNKSTGIQNKTIEANDPESLIGVRYTLGNQRLFDKGANYSSVWYSQANVSRIEEGKDAPWAIFTYPFADCEQLGKDDKGSNEGRPPWYEESCQTDKDGQCRTTPGPIVSFGIMPGPRYNRGRSCETWAKFGAASRVGRGAGTVGVAVAGMMMVWLAM